MSEQRRPTTKLGRAKRDPRVDSVPPSGRTKESKRPDPPIEATGGDIDELLGRLLARATQAEVHAQHLEQTLARLNEERVVLEARMSELVRQLDDADTHRASLEAQVKTVSQSRRTDGPVTLAYVRSMAAELVRALDRVGSRSGSSEAPTPRPPSDLPTPRSRSDRPRR
jgi:phage shock protein A